MRPFFRAPGAALPCLFALYAVALAAVVAGCAPMSPGGARPGLKHGWVSGFYTADTPRSELPACLAALPPDRLAGHLFVRIDYRAVRRMMVEVAEVPTAVGAGGQQTVKLGDRVELLPEDCLRGRLSRITKLLPPAPPPAP